MISTRFLNCKEITISYHDAVQSPLESVQCSLDTWHPDPVMTKNITSTAPKFQEDQAFTMSGKIIQSNAHEIFYTLDIIFRAVSKRNGNEKDWPNITCTGQRAKPLLKIYIRVGVNSHMSYLLQKFLQMKTCSCIWAGRFWHQAHWFLQTPFRYMGQKQKCLHQICHVWLYP